jgi:glycosyltransferase involved in cell wall biosynthesis
MLFTIILPFYNGKKFVHEAIDNVVNQDYPDWELVVIDDGSDEDNKSYISNLVNSYQNKNIMLYHKKNENVAIARNYGIERSKGEYICLLDQDDYFSISRLSEANNLLVNNQYDFIYNDRMKLSENVAKLNKTSARSKKRLSLSRDPLSNILTGNPFAPVDLIFSRKIFNKVGLFNPEYQVSNDWDMWIRIIAATSKMKYLPKPLSYYRLHDDNTSITSYDRFQKERIQILEKFFQKNHTVLNSIKQKALASAYVASATQKYKRGRYQDFRTDVLQVFRIDPYMLKPETVSRYLMSFFKK